jgi:3-phenylpropionate/trans-cinnamate dioxygenase ferredoxin subunit
VDGTFYALRDVCPHQGARLSGGVVVGWLEADGPGCYRFDPKRQLVKCPWHGWEYELATGQSWYKPESDRVRAYDVFVQTGRTLLNEAEESEQGRLPGPYVAETFAVSVENDYLVIEM